jgi:hypothetical protein
METELSASGPGGSISDSASNTYSDFDQAFFIDFALGRTIKFALGKDTNFLFDFGPAINFTYVDSNFLTERIFGLGIMGNAGFGIGLSQHLILETGVNLELLLNIGGRTEPGLSISSIGFMIPFSPYINIGYKF